MRQRLAKTKEQHHAVKRVGRFAGDANARRKYPPRGSDPGADDAGRQGEARRGWLAELDERQTRSRHDRQELEIFLAEVTSRVAEVWRNSETVSARDGAGTDPTYERIATVRHGIAVTRGLDQSCQACHVRLRPQLFNEVKTTPADHHLRELATDPLLSRAPDSDESSDAVPLAHLRPFIGGLLAVTDFTSIRRFSRPALASHPSYLSFFRTCRVALSLLCRPVTVSIPAFSKWAQENHSTLRSEAGN